MATHSSRARHARRLLPLLLLAVLAISPRASSRIRSIEDLEGRTVGVTAVGSSSYFFLKQQLRAHGMPQDSVHVRGIGGDATAVIAMERGYVAAAVMVDPALSQL